MLKDIIKKEILDHLLSSKIVIDNNIALDALLGRQPYNK